jgi:hypothetical protein
MPPVVGGLLRRIASPIILVQFGVGYGIVRRHHPEGKVSIAEMSRQADRGSPPSALSRSKAT